MIFNELFILKLSNVGYRYSPFLKEIFAFSITFFPAISFTRKYFTISFSIKNIRILILPLRKKFTKAIFRLK